MSSSLYSGTDGYSLWRGIRHCKENTAMWAHGTGGASRPGHPSKTECPHNHTTTIMNAEVLVPLGGLFMAIYSSALLI